MGDALELWLGDEPRSPRDENGTIHRVPEGWELLPPGDAGLTRRVKAAGPSWVVKAKRGRRVMSQGVWAPARTIEAERAKLESERSDPAYQRRLDAARARREREHERYVEEFTAAVVEFLAFAPRHRDLGDRVARAIAIHATPVGSGTVARTKRIAVERRAEAATIAWLRHQTTGYDDMKIPREKGKRREVRRMLAQRSRSLLARYRRGEAVDDCPLQVAVETAPSGAKP